MTMRLFVVLVAGTVAVAASAEETRFGSWSVGPITGNVGAYAATVNDSGGILGQYCFRDTARCIWVLMNDIGCKKGDKYPVLVNADVGASTTEILCIEVDGKARYAFTNFELIDDTVRRSEWLGFAFPMQNGLFKVSRFHLQGAAKAITFMRQVMDKVVESAATSTRDQTY
jgi:hypothetical protein